MTRVHRARWAFALVVSVVALAARTAKAEDTTRRLVVVLSAKMGTIEMWPDGTQAVVAELVAGGYELTLRASHARDRDALLTELATVASEPSVLGAVVVVREGARGVAYVHTQRDGTVPVTTDVSEGAVGEGALALRITQLLGPAKLDVPKASPPAATSPAVTMPDRPVPEKKPPPSTLLFAIHAGLAFTSDFPEPLPLAGLTVRKGLVGPLAVDAAAALTLGASRLETEAGSVDLAAQELTLHLSFDPIRESGIGLSLGLGGGIVWVQADGEPGADYSATSDATHVALLSARATASFTHDEWSLMLFLEPGVMLPAVTIDTGDDVARVGRPWTQASVGLGWNP